MEGVVPSWCTDWKLFLDDTFLLFATEEEGRFVEDEVNHADQRQLLSDGRQSLPTAEDTVDSEAFWLLVLFRELRRLAIML